MMNNLKNVFILGSVAKTGLEVIPRSLLHRGTYFHHSGNILLRINPTTQKIRYKIGIDPNKVANILTGVLTGCSIKP
jgi:hypothetical protein